MAAALQESAGIRHRRQDAAELVARETGLYAFYGDGRDVATHFATGKMSTSTVRRSLAALLVDELHLVPVPRDLAEPGGNAIFGLAQAGTCG